MSENEKEKEQKAKFEVLEKAIKKIETSFGKGSIMILGEETKVAPVEVIPTGSLALDIATGVGGYPRGRIVEIFGPEASGKTTLALHAIAEAQKAKGVAAIIDAEHALDLLYVKALGVDLKRLLISQPDYGEQALEIVDELVRSNAVDLIVVDSVAALVPRTEIEGSMGDMQVGLQARLMSQALRKIAGNVSRSKAVVIFTNQLRMRIGSSFTNPETTAGGLALKFYATMRIDVRKIDVIKDGSEAMGITVSAKVVKNKVAQPFKKADIDIIFGKGIVRENELFNLGVSEELIQKKGSWYFYVSEDGKEYTLGQGKANVVLFLAQNPQIAAEIERKIRKKYNLPMREKDANR
ncbi:recombinase RecA [Pseudothermotoga sp.]|uniref:recombinase RecA n=1 Tax=Pseudothermotoga sp. TaxID=2033661 RepID=UPI00299A5316|nr:recombinase RecA [Pseudothermotoga sp.]MCX7812621.1 recombinase RecA [Pseudothermotoga sp.]MDW8138901.1 recombinase RecA [Pseudothermotoga sp.]